MSRTITALFDTRADAEAGAERLREAGLDPSNVRVHDNASHQVAGAYSSTKDQGLWASIKNAFLPDEDRHTYEEGLRRGGFLLVADIADDQADQAVRVLEEANSIDLDERSAQWRSSGWDYSATPVGHGVAGAAHATQAVHATGATATGDEVVEVVEEQLVVGKREVGRGGVRVRSYVTEVPVHEQIRLREERVHVERRPVDRPLSAAGADAFQERSIELTATAEEAVVTKTARVVEEIVVSKTAEERVEQVTDTVRRTDVEIERDVATDTTVGMAPRRDV